MRVVGAGLGRTGTTSLKVALEQLLGAPCYHMVEVFANPEHIPAWQAAAEGRMPDWKVLFAGYQSVVDWPAASFWTEISAAFPEAIILLSKRDSQSWWQSAHETIFPISESMAGTPWYAMFRRLVAARFTPDLTDREACIRAYEKHVDEVLATAPRERLVIWEPSQGWGPLCQALNVPVPEQPFPRTNTRDEFAAMHGGG